MTTRVWTPSGVSDDVPALAALIAASSSGDSIAHVPGAHYSIRTPNTVWKAGGGVHLINSDPTSPNNKATWHLEGSGFLAGGSSSPFSIPTSATTPCNFSDFILDGGAGAGVLSGAVAISKGGAHTFTRVESKDFYYSHFYLAGTTGVVFDGHKMTQIAAGDLTASHGIDMDEYASDFTKNSGVIIRDCDLNNWKRQCVKVDECTSASLLRNKLRSRIALGDNATGTAVTATLAGNEIYSFVDIASQISAGTLDFNYNMFDEDGGVIIVWTSTPTVNLLANDFRGRNDWVGWTGAAWAARANVIDLGGNRRRNKPKDGGKTVFVWQGNTHQDAGYAPYVTPNSARVTGSVETSVEDTALDETNVHHAIMDDIHLVTSTLAPLAVSQTTEGYNKVVEIQPAAGLGANVSFVNETAAGTGLTYKWKNLLIRGFAKTTTGGGFQIGPSSAQNNPNTHEFHNVQVKDASTAGAGAGNYALGWNVRDGVIAKFFGAGGENLIADADGACARFATRYGIEFHGLKISGCQSLIGAGGAMRLSIPDDGAWAATTAYALNDRRRPVTRNGFRYKVTAIAGTGTSGGVEPTWPTTIGATVIDNPGANQVTWTCANADMIVDGLALVDNYGAIGGAAVYSSIAFKATWNGVSLKGNTSPAATGKQIAAATSGTALTLNSLAGDLSSGDTVQFNLTATCSITNSILNGALPVPCGGAATNADPLLDADGKPQAGSPALGTGTSWRAAGAPPNWGPDLKPFRAKAPDIGAYQVT